MPCCGIDLISGGPPGLTGIEVFTAGATITINDLLAFDTAGDVIPAIATTVTDNFQVMGVAVTAALVGAPLPVLVLHGLSRPMRFLVAPLAINNGDYIFLDTTLGHAVVVAPAPGVNTRIIVGILRGADGLTTTPNVQFQTHTP